MICEDIPTTFISPVSNADEYIWSVDGVQDVSATTQIFTTPLTAGQHTIGLTIIMGNCEYYSEHTVIVSEEPDANFTFQSSDLTYSFVADMDDPSATYNWDFGDGSPPQTGYLPTIDYTYSAEGNYIVNLTVENECGIAHYCLPITVCDLEIEIVIEGMQCANQQLNFSANSTGTGINENLSYHWTLSVNNVEMSSFEETISNVNVNINTYTLSLEVTNELGCVASDTEVLVIEECPEIIGEVGSVTVIQQSGEQWHNVSLNHTYNNAVVVMSPTSFNDADPLTIRISEITSNSFRFQIDEWDYLNGIDNGAHAQETISYLVVESGIHTLTNGQKIAAGNISSNSIWSNIPFGSIVDFNNKPVVLSQCITINETSAVNTRVKDVTQTSFKMKLEEEEASGIHMPEMTSVILIGQGIELDNDLTFEATRTPNAVTDNWYNLNFVGSYSNQAVVITKMQTHDENDAATLRYQNLTGTGVDLLVQEEQSADMETIHNDEVVGYAVFDQPSLIEGMLHTGKMLVLNPFEEAQEETAEASIICNIMPNPSDGIFMLEVYSQETAISHLTLTDVSGKVLFEETNIELNEYFRKQINLEQYPTGIYFLNVNGENASHTEKIVVY